MGSVVPNQNRLRSWSIRPVTGGGRRQVRLRARRCDAARADEKSASRSAGRRGLPRSALRNAGHIGPRRPTWAEMAAAEGPSSRSTSSTPRARCWSRLMAASSGGYRPRPIASVFRGNGQGPRRGSIFADLNRRRGQGPWWQARGGQETARMGALIDSRRHPERRPDAAFTDRTTADGAARSQPRQGRESAPFRRAQGIGAGADLRTARRRADPAPAPRPPKPALRPTACSRSISTRKWSIRPISSTARWRVTSPISRNTKARRGRPSPC